MGVMELSGCGLWISLDRQYTQNAWCGYKGNISRSALFSAVL